MAENSSESKLISMPIKMNQDVAEDFRTLSRNTGIGQGALLQVLMDSFKLEQEKGLQKEHEEIITAVQDLTQAINYKFLSLLSDISTAEDRLSAQYQKQIKEKDKIIAEQQQKLSEIDALKEERDVLMIRVNQLELENDRLQTENDKIKVQYEKEALEFRQKLSQETLDMFAEMRKMMADSKKDE